MKVYLPWYDILLYTILLILTLILAFVIVVIGVGMLSFHRYGVGPIDVVIDHQPYCAQVVRHRGDQFIVIGAEKGVCTTKSVRGTP